MLKITELKETRLRTVYTTDDYGNRERDAEEIIFTRPVKTVAHWPRFGHYIIDIICIEILFFAIGELLSTGFGIEITDNLLFLYLFLVFYYAFFEFQFQKTPGKFITKTIVIDEYGNKPDLANCFLRSLCRLVPFDPLSCLGDKSSHGWHDRWTKTWVVPNEELAIIKKLQAEQNENPL